MSEKLLGTVGDMLGSTTNQLSADQIALAVKLLKARGIDFVIPPRRSAADCPLSFAQERFWFLHRLDPRSTAYNISLTIPLNRLVDRAVAEQALNDLVGRHEILRTTFPSVDGNPVQRINSPGQRIPLPFEDVRRLSDAEKARRVNELKSQAADEPFDLDGGPPIRGLLVGFEDSISLLILTFPHIVMDGGSIDLVIRDFCALYLDRTGEQKSSLPTLFVQYADYAVWQRAEMTDDALADQLRYWTTRLAGLSTLNLPTDHPRPERMAFTGARESIAISPETSRAFQELCRMEGVTLYVGALAAFNVLLSQWCGQSDIAVGSPVANRDRPELGELIGIFLNMLVMRTDLSRVVTLRDTLAATRDTALEAFANQGMPFERLVAALAGSRNASRHPLFQVTFALERNMEMLAPQLQAPSLGSREQETIRFDLEASVKTLPEGIRVSFAYSTELFQPGTIRRLLQQYTLILEAFGRNLDQPVADLAITATAYVPTLELLSQLRALDIKLIVDGERLRADAPPGVLTPELRGELTQRKTEIIQLLRRGLKRPETPIQAVPRGGVLPISLAQQRLWFLEQLEGGSAVYNVAGGMSLSDTINADALAWAVDEAVKRHESLRTSFPTVDGAATVAIAPFRPNQLERIDLRSMPARDRKIELDRLIATYARRPFDLAHGPLFRAWLIQMGDAEFVLFFCMHHIISDAWSMQVFGNELAALYEAFVTGQPSPLPPLPLQFVDFAGWQRDRLKSDGFNGQLGYWTQHLAGRLPVLQLPTDRPRPAVQTFNGRRTRFQIGTELTNALKELSRREGASLFMTLLAGFLVLLHRYTGDEDIIVGSPTAGRNRPELDGLIGFFVNNLVLRVDLSGDPTFRQILARTRRVLLNGHANQDVPFDQLVEVLRPERSASHPPLFQVMFNSPTTPVTQLDRPESRAKSVEPQVGISRFELTLEYYEETEEPVAGPAATLKSTGVRMYWEYNTDLFDAETIEQMERHYTHVLQSVVAKPDQLIGTVPLLGETELRRQIQEWNATGAPRSGDRSVADLFEEQVRNTPDATAVIWNNQPITYAELDRQANRLARYLRRQGAARETLVGICLDRSAAMIVAVLGVLKSGAAYVPLDPTYPVDRLRYMIDDSGLSILLTEEQFKNHIPGIQTRTVLVDGDAQQITQEPDTPLDSKVAPEQRAYVIYTSGSTGKPKGVEIEHRSVVNFLAAMRREPGLTSSDRLLSVTTLSFDIAVLEIFLPLTVGATVVVASRSATADPAQLMDLMSRPGATVMQATPATWRMLIEAGWAGDQQLKVLCGGEALSRDLAEQLLPLVGELWNMYGPTEATVWCTLQKVASGSGPISIGRPIANLEVHVLDRFMQPVPVGVTGELFIGGDGLARGYLNRPELTAERFIPSPFAASGKGARLYRTGDLVRLRRDGSIEWLRRVDGQTKIRGFRIELGEIEAALVESGGIAQAVVTVREVSAGDHRLAAYLVPAKGQTVDLPSVSLRLRGRLPEYMMPSSYTVMETLPLLPNGKVNRSALPAPDAVAGSERPGYVAPGTESERAIAAIWSEVLGTEKIGLHDTFFDLGGHSLLIVRVHHRLERQFTNPPSLVELFQYPTVASLAERLTRGVAVKSFHEAQGRAVRQAQA